MLRDQVSMATATAAVIAGALFDLSSAQVQHQDLPEIPVIGLGTWLSDANKVAHAVEYALDHGYNHIDTALIYKNEAQVGEGIAESGLPRSYFWVTSKLWNTHHRPEQAHKAIQKTLADLGVGSLDLYLMHWPVAFVPGVDGDELDDEVDIVDTWKAMEDIVRQGLTRYIGVSNFSPRDMKKILAHCEICPYAHEFETHPYLQQQEFVDWHHKHNIKVVAYSPLANTNPTYHSDVGAIFDDEFWKELAATKNATVAQAVLAWGRQRGTIVIPKSVHVEHIEENLASLQVKFTEEEMDKIAGQNKRKRMNDPGKAWGVDLFEGLEDSTEKKEKHDYDNEEL